MYLKISPEEVGEFDLKQALTQGGYDSQQKQKLEGDQLQMKTAKDLLSRLKVSMRIW